MLLKTVVLLVVLVLAKCKDKVGIIHMHGVCEGWFEHTNFRKHVGRYSGIPTNRIHLLNEYKYGNSLTNMNEQVENILPNVKKIAAQYDKVIAVGFSQGGLIWRAMLEEWDDHNVDMFISLASPQGGVFGVPSLAAKLIPFFDWYARTTIYKALYTSFAQRFSIFNYFLDPTQLKEYMSSNIFLPYLNNELGTDADKLRKKTNFSKIRKLILIGGKDEDVIDPWQSEMFGFYTANGHAAPVVPMEVREIYTKDLFGLKTLNERGSITICRFDGLTHLQFRDNKRMLNACVLPPLRDYQ